MKSLLPFALVSLVLAGCASPESRLRAGLVEAGLNKRPASCLAREMADELSIGQLIKVSKLGSFRDKRLGEMSVNEFLKATRSLQEPEIVRIAAAAAVVCAIKG